MLEAVTVEVVVAVAVAVTMGVLEAVGVGTGVPAAVETVTLSTCGLSTLSLVLRRSRYCRYRPAGLPIAWLLAPLPALHPLQLAPSTELRVATLTPVPAGAAPTQLSVPQFTTAPASTAQLTYSPLPPYWFQRTQSARNRRCTPVLNTQYAIGLLTNGAGCAWLTRNTPST